MLLMTWNKKKNIVIYTVIAHSGTRKSKARLTTKAKVRWCRSFAATLLLTSTTVSEAAKQSFLCDIVYILRRWKTFRDAIFSSITLDRVTLITNRSIMTVQIERWRRWIRCARRRANSQITGGQLLCTIWWNLIE